MLTLSSLVLLLFGFSGGRLLSNGFIGAFFNVHAEYALRWAITPMGFITDIITIVGFLGALVLAHRGWNATRQYRYYLLVGLFMTLSTVFFLLTARQFYGTTYGTHDGAVESEVAAQMLLDGKNPYATDFYGTTFGAYHPFGPDGGNSPVPRYYPYPPLVPLLTVPVVAVANGFHLQPDARVVTILAFFVLVTTLIRTVRTPRYKKWLVLGLLCNPLVYAYPFVGINDIFFVLCLVATAVLSRRRSFLLAAVMLGCALAAKQTAILALPLWCWWMWLEYRGSRLLSRTLWQAFGALLVTTLVFYLPFFLWNPSAMVDDLVRFVGGSIPYTYPIGGDSLWQFGILSRHILSEWALTPHVWFTLGAVLLAIPITARWIRRRPTANQWLVSVVASTFLVSLMNRYFFENYVSALMLLLIAAIACLWRDHEDGVASAALPE